MTDRRFETKLDKDRLKLVKEAKKIEKKLDTPERRDAMVKKIIMLNEGFDKTVRKETTKSGKIARHIGYGFNMDSGDTVDNNGGTDGIRLWIRAFGDLMNPKTSNFYDLYHAKERDGKPIIFLKTDGKILLDVVVKNAREKLKVIFKNKYFPFVKSGLQFAVIDMYFNAPTLLRKIVTNDAGEEVPKGLEFTKHIIKHLDAIEQDDTELAAEELKAAIREVSERSNVTNDAGLAQRRLVEQALISKGPPENIMVSSQEFEKIVKSEVKKLKQANKGDDFIIIGPLHAGAKKWIEDNFANGEFAKVKIYHQLKRRSKHDLNKGELLNSVMFEDFTPQQKQKIKTEEQKAIKAFEKEVVNDIHATFNKGGLNGLLKEGKKLPGMTFKIKI